MKKFIIISAIACFFSGCSSPIPEKEIINNRLYDITTDEKLGDVRTQFKNRFNKIFNYSAISLDEITSDITIHPSVFRSSKGVENQLDPRLTTMNKCFEDGTLKIESVKISNSQVFQFGSSEEEIKKCILTKANDPMTDSAILLLKETNIFNELKNTQPLREKLDKYKADGIITIKEYMDILQTISSIEQSKRDQNMKNVIKNL